MAKVDMSREAVGERLRLMGELCELAMKLSQSKVVGKAGCDTEESPADADEDCPECGNQQCGCRVGDDNCRFDEVDLLSMAERMWAR
jgi:hypothetical protein